MLRFLSLALLLGGCAPALDDSADVREPMGDGFDDRKGVLDVTNKVCRFTDGTSQACCLGGATDPYYGVSCSFCGQNEGGQWICDDGHDHNGTVRSSDVR